MGVYFIRLFEGKLHFVPYMLIVLSLTLVSFEENAWGGETILLDPENILTSAKRIDFVGRNNFSLKKTELGAFLLSMPQNSASGLYQKVDIDGKSLTRVRWTWRVDKVQASADLRDLKLEDSAASIFFIFGEPSFFNKDVPTLAYVWSSTPVNEGTILQSLRYQTLKYIQMRGIKSVGQWHLEERNIALDFKKIFGIEPGVLKYIALFNDNDQTLEPASAFFGKIVEN